MFQPTQHELQTVSEALGWLGTCVGPIRQMGTVVWPVITLTGNEYDGCVPATVDVDISRVELVGCLVVGEATASLVSAASLFAGYAPRAVVVTGQVPLDVIVDAAVLDQGVVAVSVSGPEVLSLAGPRVHSKAQGDPSDAKSAEQTAPADLRAERQSRGSTELKEKALAALRRQAESS